MAAGKRKVAKKKVTRNAAKKKVTRKAAKKKVPRKTGRTKAAKKITRRKVARKVAKKKVARKVAKKKVARKVAKKKVARTTVRKRSGSGRSIGAKGAVRKAAGGKARTRTENSRTKAGSSTRSKSVRGATAGNGSKPQAARRLRSPYTKPQLRPLRQALLALRIRIMGDLNLLEDEALRAVDPDISAEDVAAHGTDAFERTITLNLMENDARRIQRIDAALARMQTGAYGLCDVCHGPIPLLRLEALPFAQACVQCQEKQERGH